MDTTIKDHAEQLEEHRRELLGMKRLYYEVTKVNVELAVTNAHLQAELADIWAAMGMTRGEPRRRQRVSC